MSHGSYSHIIYVEEIGDVSEADKLVHTVTTMMLRDMMEYLVAIIVETNAQSTEMRNMPQDVNGRFKSWKTLLCMQFPNVSNQPDVERKNIVVRHTSLHRLEETLGKLKQPCFLSKFSPSMNQGSKFLNDMQITLTWSYFDQLWNFHNRFYTTYDPFKLTNIEVLDLTKMSDLPFTSEVFYYPHFVKLKSKVIFLELKWELS